MTDAAAMSDRQRWAALYVLCTGMLMIVLDATIVNVALPSIQDDLDFSQNALAWVVNAYLIAFGGFLLLSGRIGDLVGQRRIFLVGLTIFTVASLACAAAPTQGVLIAARFVQGLGGSLASAVILGMIVTMFPEPREQAKAIGVYGFVASSGSAIGLILGGILTELISWHWIFLVNLPIGVVTALLAVRLVEDREGIGLQAGADIPGAGLVTGALMLGVFTILGVEQHGWTSLRTLAGGIVAIAMLVGFVVRQDRIETPLMPLRLFRSRNTSGANLIQGLLVVGMFGVFFLGALYLQRVLGYDPLEVGLAFLPASVGMAILSLGFTERLTTAFGPKSTLLAGTTLLGVALLLLLRTPVDGSYVEHILPPMTLMGIGAGLAFPALAMLAMSGATPQDAGLASGLVNTSAQVGGAIGLAVLATLSTSRTQSQLDDGKPLAEALNAGYHLAYLVGAVLIGVSLVLSAIVIRRPAPMGAPEQALAEAEGEALAAASA